MSEGNTEYFNFFSTIKLTQGYTRCVIQDLQNNKYYFINKGAFDFFVKTFSLSIQEIKESYNCELDTEIMQWLEWAHRQTFGRFYSKLNSFSVMDDTWDFPGVISNAVLDLTSDSLIGLPTNEIFADLGILGCDTIEIRIFEDNFSLTLLDSIFESVQKSELLGAELILPYSLFSVDFEDFIRPYNKFRRLTFWGSNEPIDSYRKNGTLYYFTKKIINSEHCCGVVTQNYFTNNIPMYTESNRYNSCLNRKISIDREGLIKNCPSLIENFGNIRNVRLTEAVKQLDFMKYWSVTKDQIDVCKVCEFRYMCVDCRAYTDNRENHLGKPAKCNYDPYTGEWK